MTDIHVLAAQPRERAGKGAARATRRAGLIPAVIYGDKKAPVMVALEPKTLMSELHKAGFRTTLYDIKVGGDAYRVLARDVHFHPVTDNPLHVDFQRVGKDSTIHVAVPVLFENDLKSPGLKRGGVLNVVMHEIDLVCRADSIPAKLVVDLSGMDIGDSVHMSQIALPDGVRPYNSQNFTVATVAPPTVMKAGEVAAEQAAAAAASAASAAAAGKAPVAAAAPAKAPAKK